MIGGDSLSRFFALHVFVIPAVLLAFLAIHLWLVLKCGVSAPPVPGERSIRGRTTPSTKKQLKDGVPFLGDAMLKDVIFSALVGDRRGRALPRSSAPRVRPARPIRRLSGANPRPEWPFLWLFALSVAQPARRGDVYHPGVSGDLDRRAACWCRSCRNRGERGPSRRPVAVLSVIVIYTVLGMLTYEGATAPWSPQMTAWSGDPVPGRDWSKRMQPEGTAWEPSCSKTRIAAIAMRSTGSAADAAPI